MLRVFYQNGKVEEFEGEGMASTPRNARRWAVALVTGVTANNDIYKTEYWGLDADGVESCESFINRENVKL